MKYRVLIPIDSEEERAVAQAQTAARLPVADEEVEVTLLHVFDDTERAKETSVKQLTSGKRAYEELERLGVAVEEMKRPGDPADEILAAADDIGADMIILGGRKRSPLGSLLFGSVSQAVILDAARPVTVTGNTTNPDPSHVCQSCGERYYTEAPEINTCQACGGTKVTSVE